MSDTPDLRGEQIVAAIERYLAINPSAADSCVGIAQWWLPSLGMQCESDEVERALLLLQARGGIESVQVGDSERFWRASMHPEEQQRDD